MSNRALKLILILALVGGVHQALAVETGKKAAMKYFTKKPASTSTFKAPRGPASTSYAQLFSLSAGALVNGKSYQWLDDELGGWNLQLSYRRATTGWLAQAFHLEFQKFTTLEEEFSKVSFLLNFVFPRSISFPVYIGAGAGPGFFLNQYNNESLWTMDYKGYIGLRLNQDHSQFILESGVKNHVHMLSDGQFIGWFVSSGVAYKF